MPAHRSRSISANGAITTNSTATATSFSSSSNSNTGAHKQRLFQCTGYGDCRMVFTRSEHLARHARKHTGEKPFQCIMPDCNKMFSRFDNMMQHTQTHRNHQQHQQQQQQQPMLRRRRRSSTSSSSSTTSTISSNSSNSSSSSSTSNTTSTSASTTVATLSDNNDPVTTTTNNSKANISTKQEQPRRLSIADLCNPLTTGDDYIGTPIQPSPSATRSNHMDTTITKPKNTPMLLTPDELEALQAFGRLQRATTPDFFDSLRDLVSDRQQQCPCL